MPVILCNNGKYRIGSGACIYDTEEKAIEVYQAILAGGGFVDADKVSIDFDDTLSTPKGQDLAKRLIAEGKNVYIVTRRQSSASAEVYKVTDELRIQRSKVHFTNGKMKWEEIKKLGIGTHYDNNQKEIDLINSNTEAKGIKFQFAESFTDYPEASTNNAKRALAYAEKNGWGSCGTPVGKARANQLANKEPISRDTIARMASFKRHQQNKDVPYSEGCGGLMWDAWGGTEGIEWAIRKLDQIDNASN
jgi:hypothetical protein